jgi:polyisoprenoid-binding protein YceI
MKTIKKRAIFAVILFSVCNISAQKIITKTGDVKFLASIPQALEEVAADNNSVSAILDTSNGNVAVQALIKAFKFKVPLMEEHFNENYLESNKYPKANFSGKIVGFDASKLTANKTAYDVEGNFTLHGVTKKIKIKAFVSKVAGKTVVVSSFTIKPEDYEIKIPSLVRGKVADNVKVSTSFSLQ